MPLIIPANTLSSGDFVTNSLRISPSDDGFLERTTSGVADSNRKTWTFSWWAKLTVGVEQHLYGFRVNADNMSYLRLNSDGQMRFANEDYGGTVHRVQTNRYFRDPSSWFHIVLRVDTTEANRVRFYINGSEETSMSSTDYPAQNYDLEINQADAFVIGAMRNTNGTTTGQVDGYLSEVHFVDGQSYAPTVFGEYNDNGVWIPKDCKADITYGTRGFYMQFKETGTSANSSGMGADTSGNNNHFTPNNLVALDITTDTPTNNFCTVNPLGGATSSSKWTFSEGNTQIQQNDNGNWRATGSTMAVANGKWYWEIEFDAGTLDEIFVGVHDSDVSLEGTNRWVTGSTLFYNHVGGEIRQDGTNTDNNYGELDHGDILGVALNMDDKQISFYDNGSAIISNFSLSSGITGFAMPTFMSDANNVVYKVNFGNPPFSVSSGNADANGYGNFEYAVPSGYYALCTKNLAEFG